MSFKKSIKFIILVCCFSLPFSPAFTENLQSLICESKGMVGFNYNETKFKGQIYGHNDRYLLSPLNSIDELDSTKMIKKLRPYHKYKLEKVGKTLYGGEQSSVVCEVGGKGYMKDFVTCQMFFWGKIEINLVTKLFTVWRTNFQSKRGGDSFLQVGSCR